MAAKSVEKIQDVDAAGRKHRKQMVSRDDIVQIVLGMQTVLDKISLEVSHMEHEHILSMEVDGANQWERATQLMSGYRGNLAKARSDDRVKKEYEPRPAAPAKKGK